MSRGGWGRGTGDGERQRSYAAEYSRNALGLHFDWRRAVQPAATTMQRRVIARGGKTGFRHLFPHRVTAMDRCALVNLAAKHVACVRKRVSGVPRVTPPLCREFRCSARLDRVFNSRILIDSRPDL